jgi:hypothetical protein
MKAFFIVEAFDEPEDFPLCFFWVREESGQY